MKGRVGNVFPPYPRNYKKSSTYILKILMTEFTKYFQKAVLNKKIIQV